jgi:hypothetical protein
VRVSLLGRKLLLLGSKGLTRDYHPYTSSVWGFEAMPYIISKVFIQKHTCNELLYLIFIILLLSFVFKQKQDKSENDWIDLKHAYSFHCCKNKFLRVNITMTSKKVTHENK